MVRSLMQKIRWDKVVWGYTIRHWFWGIVASCVSYKLFHGYFMPWYSTLQDCEAISRMLAKFGVLCVIISGFSSLITSRVKFVDANRALTWRITLALFVSISVSMVVLGMIGLLHVGVFHVGPSRRGGAWIIPICTHFVLFSLWFYEVPRRCYILVRLKLMDVQVVSRDKDYTVVVHVDSMGETSGAVFKSRYYGTKKSLQADEQCTLAYDSKNPTNNMIVKILKPKTEVEV
jgi:hypothetical protein